MLWISSSEHIGRSTSAIFKDDAGNSIGGERKAAGRYAAESLLAGADEGTRARVAKTYGKLPLSFEANEGQFDSRVKFVSRAGGQTLFLTATEALLRVESAGRPSGQNQHTPSVSLLDGAARRENRVKSAASVLRLKLVGANALAKVTGLDELPGKTNYFIGSDPQKWKVNVPNYAKVKVEQIYPCVDLVYYGNQRQLEYDLIVAPGANLEQIRFSIEGAKRITVDETGDLVMATAAGETRQQKPRVYQNVSGAKKELAAHYVVLGRNQFAFAVSSYDHSVPLVIDPVLTYSTYLGGSSYDVARAIAVDAAGNAYIAGYTESVDFPIRNGLPASMLPFVSEAFVAKLNPSGTALLYSTYLGGSDVDEASAIAVDSSGNAYTAGLSFSNNFPVVNPFQHAYGGVQDAFVAKVGSAGNSLVFSTFLGGASVDEAKAIAVDSAGSAYVTGVTASADFPVANALQPTLVGTLDAFIAKFNSAGEDLVYSTYLGGEGSEFGLGVAVDFDGQAYVAGSTSSIDFPLTNPIQLDFKGRTLFKTIDEGNNWESINTGLPVHRAVTAIAVDRLTPSTLYAGTAGLGVFKSTNGGANWVPANSGLGLSINALAIDPQASNVVFAATAGGVYKSTNGGASWAISRFNSSACVSFDPSNSLTVYAGTFQGLSKSTNSGATWVSVIVRDNNFPGESSGTIRAIAVDPVTPSTLYVAGLQTFIFKSLNGGVTWQLSSNGLQPFGFRSLAIDPFHTATIYTSGARNGIFKSTDSGQNWARIFASRPTLVVNSLVIDPSNSSTVFAGTFGSSVFKSSDGGNNWVSTGSGLSNSFIYALAIDPIDTSTVYAGAEVADDGFVAKVNPGGSALLYSTYLGGDEGDACYGIAVDRHGSAYVTGVTYATNFPTANSLQPLPGGSYDAFVSKLNPQGAALVYSTYLGGGDFDWSIGIAVDSAGNALVTGVTSSVDFPVVRPLPGSGSDPQGNAFVSKLSSTGAMLAYSTQLGGPSNQQSFGADTGYAIAVDTAGNAYLTGETASDQFPTTPGAFQRTKIGISNDAFVAKISEQAPFDLCLQDESNGTSLQINSATGDYQLVNCAGITLSGTGALTRRGCLITLQVNGPDRRLLARIDTCTKSGTATIQVFSQGATFTIMDRNTANSTCGCGGG